MRVRFVVPRDRPIVDSSFDVGLLVAFESLDAMRAYLDHPIHRKAVEEVLRPLARKIVVYDFIEDPGAPG